MADNPAVQPLKYPWSPDGDIRANFAIGSLRESVRMWMTLEGRVHADTLMVVVGSIYGMASQNAVLEEYVIPGKTIPPNGLVTLQTTSGESFYSGDLLNRYLVPEQGYTYSLWGVLAAAVLQAGVTQTELPNVADMFRRAASSLGSPEFDKIPMPPGHQVGLSPRQAVELFWLYAVTIFTRENEPGPAAGQKVAPQHWPLITAVVASQFVTQTKQVMDPRLSFSLLMNAAIVASKYDRRSLKLRPAPSA